MMEGCKMEQNFRGNLKISGAGSSGGGVFDQVRISGAGHIEGNIECNLFDISGAGNIRGDVKTKTAKINGAGDVKGNITAEDLKVNGGSTFEGTVTSDKIYINGGSQFRGDVRSKYIKINGSSDINGNLNSDEIEISGSLDVQKDCEAEKFKASGGFKIGGLLNADIIDIKVYGKCTAKEIGGENIQIRRGSNDFFGLRKIVQSIFNYKEYLISEVIEGDNVSLEATIAKVVRGNNVSIGSECVIDLVEYRGELKVLDGASVKEQRKI
jgi:cytoskeletal protein CcmA (bactofilin family)